MKNDEFADLMLWGHSLNDFCEMFALTEKDLQASILDCCSGPDSFNAELTKQGGRVVSCDPLFGKSISVLTPEIQRVFSKQLDEVTKHEERFIWDESISLDELAKARTANIELFLQDYTKGLEEQRYVYSELPDLSLEENQHFDLALCSHALFANSKNQTLEFHLQAIKNLCQVASEVRIFPLVDSAGEISPLVGPVMQALYHEDLALEFKAVPYQFQSKGNAMLKVFARSCEI